jgi:glycerate kinase
MTPMKKILLAIDSFKGCLSSEEVEAAFSQALTACGAEVRSLPMSDGGFQPLSPPSTDNFSKRKYTTR